MDVNAPEFIPPGGGPPSLSADAAEFVPPGSPVPHSNSNGDGHGMNRDAPVFVPDTGLGDGEASLGAGGNGGSVPVLSLDNELGAGTSVGAGSMGMTGDVSAMADLKGTTVHSSQMHALAAAGYMNQMAAGAMYGTDISATGSYTGDTKDWSRWSQSMGASGTYDGSTGRASWGSSSILDAEDKAGSGIGLGEQPGDSRKWGGEEAFARLLRIPQARVGLVIGQKGQTVRYMEQLCQTRISIEQEVPDVNTATVQIAGGTEEVVARAERLMEGLVEGQLKTHEIMHMEIGDEAAWDRIRSEKQSELAVEALAGLNGRVSLEALFPNLDRPTSDDAGVPPASLWRAEDENSLPLLSPLSRPQTQPGSKMVSPEPAISPLMMSDQQIMSPLLKPITSKALGGTNGHMPPKASVLRPLEDMGILGLATGLGSGFPLDNSADDAATQDQITSDLAEHVAMMALDLDLDEDPLERPVSRSVLSHRIPDEKVGAKGLNLLLPRAAGDSAGANLPPPGITSQEQGGLGNQLWSSPPSIPPPKAPQLQAGIGYMNRREPPAEPPPPAPPWLRPPSPTPPPFKAVHV